MGNCRHRKTREKSASDRLSGSSLEVNGDPNHRRRKQYSKRLTETDVVLLVTNALLLRMVYVYAIKLCLSVFDNQRHELIWKQMRFRIVLLLPITYMSQYKDIDSVGVSDRSPRPTSEFKLRAPNPGW